MKVLLLMASFLLQLTANPALADVTLPKLISDGMVLQRDAKINIWGWATAGEKIAVKFNGRTYQAATSTDGQWRTSLSPTKAGGPFTLEIKGKNSIVLHDVLVGDVWFCSGQSNMVLTMERVKEKYPEDVSKADYSKIRNFLVPTYSDVSKVHNDLPQGKWVATTPETVLGFGAVAYFFARTIHQKYGVPIGIINSSVGGTPAQAWISEEGLRESEFSELIRKFKDTTYLNQVMRPNIPVEPILPPDPDQGMTGPIKWYDTAYVAKGWHDFWLPGFWEDQGVKNLDGVVWFRKEINVPASMTGPDSHREPGRLFMGRIVDADEVYVNGTKIGNINYQYPPRRYAFPTSLLKPGKNVVVIRVTNQNGKGGFVPDKPYFLEVNNEKIELRGSWKYRVGQIFPPKAPSAPAFSAQNSPTGLYNTMVAPVIPYTIKGINWYQGESNTSRPEIYGKLLTFLINDWRAKWGQGTLPFAFVQLANFMEEQYSPAESEWATLRNEQRKTLAVPQTAMVVAIDAGEWNDIHPLNKKDVGERLALTAEYLAYGDKGVVYSGPLYQSHEIRDGKISIAFTNVGGGLVTKGDEDLQYFELAGEDRKFYRASAKIEGNKVTVWSERVVSPMYVRYAWADNPASANLYNKEGLPASPFETENRQQVR